MTSNILLILFSIVLFSCNSSTVNEEGSIDASHEGKTTEQCRYDVRAYELGREMQTWVKLRSSGLSLEDAITEYFGNLGIDPPYDANNDCVKRGFNDAFNGKESPYNTEGKSWSTF